MNDNEKITYAAAGCVAALVIGATIVATITITTILNGLVLSVLWGWFMVPLLGLPPLTAVQAIGIILVVALLTHQVQPNQKNGQEDPLISVLLIIFAKPAMFLLMGWIVKMFL